jgi:hypothetical protein
VRFPERGRNIMVDVARSAPRSTAVYGARRIVDEITPGKAPASASAPQR